MAHYKRFCSEAKIKIDEFFEVDVIMRDYHEHLAAEAADTSPSPLPLNPPQPATLLSQFGFMALTACCTCTT